MGSLELEKQKRQATELLVNGEYKQAIELLVHLQTLIPDDVDILLELAHGNWQLSRFDEAKKIYIRVLRLHPGNSIATKKLASIATMLQKAPDGHKISPAVAGKRAALHDLIEEPGRAKSVRLSTIGKHEELALLTVGEEVFLSIRKRKIEVRDNRRHFVGYLPDDISKRLIELMGGGVTYQAFMHVVDKQECRVFIREIKKPTRYANVASFPLETTDLLTPNDDDDEEKPHKTEDDGDIDLESEETIIPTKDPADDEEEEDEEKDEDDKVYREYEE